MAPIGVCYSRPVERTIGMFHVEHFSTISRPGHNKGRWAFPLFMHKGAEARDTNQGWSPGFKTPTESADRASLRRIRRMTAQDKPDQRAEFRNHPQPLHPTEYPGELAAH